MNKENKNYKNWFQDTIKNFSEEEIKTYSRAILQMHLEVIQDQADSYFSKIEDPKARLKIRSTYWNMLNKLFETLEHMEK